MLTPDSTDAISPRSALRYRPIHKSKQSGTDSAPVTTATPLVQRASRPRPRITDTQADVIEWEEPEDNGVDTKQQTKTTAAIPRASVMPKRLPKTPVPRTTTHDVSKKLPASMQGKHPLFYLGIGMLSMLLIWVVVFNFVGWFNSVMDNIHYGYPRTFQTDAVVGHNDSSSSPSHFIAINLHGQVEIIEMPGGEATHARIYVGPDLYTAGNELVPVTLKFADVNGDGHPDMVVQIQGSSIVYINEKGGFRPLRPEEKQPVEQFLQQHPLS